MNPRRLTSRNAAAPFFLYSFGSCVWLVSATRRAVRPGVIRGKIGWSSLVNTPVAPSRNIPSSMRFLTSRRFWIYLAVISLWGGVMAQIWHREVGRQGTSLNKMGISPEVMLVSWTDYEQWMWIEQNDRRIGLTTMSINPLSDPNPAPRPRRSTPGYQMMSRTRVVFRLLGFELPAEIASQVNMNTAFEMDTLQAGLRVAGQALQIQAFVQDRQLYYQLKIEARASSASASANPALSPWQGILGQLPQGAICGRSPLSEPIFLTDAVIPVLTRSETLKPGESWVTQAANPLAGLTQAEVRVTVDGREDLEMEDETIPTWRLVEQIGSALHSKVWYDLHGRMMKRELGNGMRLIPSALDEGDGSLPGI